ncbi:MAG TPA: xanthine dehydrogenase family protein subunit M [Anaerolineales bacterium]|nr:xanthine dehydrogenase family protein subunit M [Anaerolineales bacterium]
MKPPPFEYMAPETLPEALAAAREHGGEAKLLAGGQSLVPSMNFRVSTPSLLIDLNRIPDLDYIRRDPDGSLRIGAMTRQHRLETDALVREAASLLAHAAPFIAHPQIRNRGTLGGSLAHADPAAELPVVALALEARMQAATNEGRRWIEAKDFFQGMFTTSLAPEEILVEIALPRQPGRTGVAFDEFARRRGDYALMGVAALVRLDGKGVCESARLVFLNAGDGPVVAPEAAALLQGQNVTPKTAEAAARHAAEKEIEPIGNLHATPAFQRHLARVLATRVIVSASQRAAA